MRTVILLLLTFFCLQADALLAQSSSDTIVIGKQARAFKYQGKQIKPSKLTKIVKTNPDAAKEMRIANNYNVGATIFSVAGGFCVGFPLGTALAGGEPKWALAGAGAGLIVISLPLSHKYRIHTRKAVSIYNQGILHSSVEEPVFFIGFSDAGLGLNMRF